MVCQTAPLVLLCLWPNFVSPISGSVHLSMQKCTDTLLFKVWLAVTIIVPSIFILLLVFGTCQFAKTEKKEGVARTLATGFAPPPPPPHAVNPTTTPHPAPYCTPLQRAAQPQTLTRQPPPRCNPRHIPCIKGSGGSGELVMVYIPLQQSPRCSRVVGVPTHRSGTPWRALGAGGGVPI